MTAAFDGTHFTLAWKSMTVVGEPASFDLHGAETRPDGTRLSTFAISEAPEQGGRPFLGVNGNGQLLAA